MERAEAVPPHNGGKVAGCKPTQQAEPELVACLDLWKVQIRAVAAEKPPGLLWPEVVELDLEVKTPQSRLVESLHEVCRGDEYAKELLHLGQHFVHLSDFPGAACRLPVLEETVDFVDKQESLVVLRLPECLRDILFRASDPLGQKV